MCIPNIAAFRADLSGIKLNKGVDRKEFEQKLINVVEDGNITAPEKKSLLGDIRGSSKGKLENVLSTMKTEANSTGFIVGLLRVNAAQQSLENLLGTNDPGKQIAYGYDTGRSNVTRSSVSLEGIDSENSFNILNKISQVDNLSSTEFDQSRCGASSLVGAALLNGSQGLEHHIDAIWNEGFKLNEQNENDQNFLVTLKEKISEGKRITNGDISKLQEITHKILKSTDTSDGSGLSPQRIIDFIRSDTNIMNDFRHIGGKITLIDNDQDGQGNHFVLSFRDKDGSEKIYDPYPRKDGNQIISDPSVVQKYKDSTR